MFTAVEQILVYADSLTWGIIPNSRMRLAFDKRWPGVVECALNAGGANIRVIENCLNGRRTIWSDPVKEGRDGSRGLAEVIEMHSPLKLVILMLGTNDFQASHDNNAAQSARGTQALIEIIRNAPIEPGMPVPEIMIVAPPEIVEPKSEIAAKFKGAEKKCVGLAAELRKVSERLETHYFNAADVTGASVVDGIHLDEDQHLMLGQTLAEKISGII